MLNNQRTVQDVILKLIRTKTGINDASLLSNTNWEALGLETLDVVDIILEVEKLSGTYIPDGLPLRTANDLIDYLYAGVLQQAG